MCIQNKENSNTSGGVKAATASERRKHSFMQILGYVVKKIKKTTILKKTGAPGKVSLGEFHTLWHNSHLDLEMFPLEAFQKWLSLPHYLMDSMILSKTLLFCLLIPKSVVDGDYFMKVSEKTLKSVVIQSLCMLCVAGHVWLESQLGQKCEQH